MSSRDEKPAKPSTSRAGGIRTLSDLNRPTAHNPDSDSDEPQEYYTGGEKSVLKKWLRRKPRSAPFDLNLRHTPLPAEAY